MLYIYSDVMIGDCVLCAGQATDGGPVKELDTRSKFKRSLKREMLTKYKLHM